MRFRWQLSTTMPPLQKELVSGRPQSDWRSMAGDFVGQHVHRYRCVEIGDGGVGLIAARFIKQMSAKRIIGIEPSHIARSLRSRRYLHPRPS